MLADNRSFSQKRFLGVTFSPELRLVAADGAVSFPVDPEATRYIPAGFAIRHDVLPYGLDGSELLVAVPDGETSTVDRIRLLTGMRVRATTLPRSDIRAHVAAVYGEEAVRPSDDERSSPSVRIVDEIHATAVRNRASDVHVEPGFRGGRVRERIDGALAEVRSLDKSVYSQVVARIKILGGLDVADRRQPQDGRYTFTSCGHTVDTRVSSIATIDGERLVLRLFDSARQRPRLNELGMDAQTLARFQELIGLAHGFIVVCGPTGTGKTTTLYAALEERRSDREHACTIEDPIEMRLDGIAQIQVNRRAGMTFASALKAVLRQDPDVVMIGEMRDAETANIAVSAALAGQSVMATMHSANAIRAIERLVDLGIPRHAIAASLTGIVAQRLVRTVCTPCTGERDCKRCLGAGFTGRTGIFECVPVSPELCDAISAGATGQQLIRLVERDAVSTLARDGLRQVMAGRTTAEEVQRVIGERNVG